MRFNIIVLTAMLLPQVSAGADVAPVGRLFSTPAERAVLDRLRQNIKPDSALSEQADAAVPTTPAEPVREQFTLDGFVRRSSGKNTTWINQIPQTEGEISHGIRVRQQLSRAPAVSILLPSGKRLKLKAGQTFDGVTGKVSEVYEAIPEALTPKAEK